MNEDFLLPNQSDDEESLSDDDLAVLQAFDAKEEWSTQPISLVSVASSEASNTQNASDETDDDMLLLFTTEVDEAITTMRRVLHQLESEDTLDAARFKTLQRVAHRIRGTAGSMECHALAAIAHYMENIVEQIQRQLLFPIIGLNALVQAVLKLEQTLQSLIAEGQESRVPLTELEDELKQLGIHLQSSRITPRLLLEEVDHLGKSDVAESSQAHGDKDQQVQEPSFASPLASAHPVIHVDAQRFEHLMRHSEQLTELSTPLESAQTQVEAALQELQAAQSRLQQIETSFNMLSSSAKPTHFTDEHPASSLIARILSDASQRNNGSYPRKIKTRLRLIKAGSAASWDELEVERFTERDAVLLSLSETIADVSLASTKVQAAYKHLNTITQRYVERTINVQKDLLLARLAPLKTLVPFLQNIVAESPLGQEQLLHLEVSGETLEIDRNILEALVPPLFELLKMCLSDATQDLHKPQRAWLSALDVSNEIRLELGFSMPVPGGALEAVSVPIQRLNGSISPQRNSMGGVSFYLRLPRLQGAVRSLMVRVGKQHLLLPFSQVQRLSDERREGLDVVYSLSKLLNIPSESDERKRIMPVVILPQGVSRMIAGVVVDEVVGDVEAVVRPLVSYLQRPGITGTVIDGKGNALLMLDMPELIKYYNTTRRHLEHEERDLVVKEYRQPTVLIADDSPSFRRLLLHMLEHANYRVMEAKDGVEALERMIETPPDVFLLDMEMPNMNGYDLLSIMHLYHELNDVRTIMLTSRSSDKHKQHARELGAHAYLTKPCSHEMLLRAIETVLAL